MNKRVYILSLILVSLLLMAASCKKENSYTKNSIEGTWRCFENIGINSPRDYNVQINYYNPDDYAEITLLNLYNLGYEFEVWATVEDTTITINYTNSLNNDITGIGHFTRDYSVIYWELSYFGNAGSDPNIEAFFRRP